MVHDKLKQYRKYLQDAGDYAAFIDLFCQWIWKEDLFYNQMHKKGERGAGFLRLIWQSKYMEMALQFAGKNSLYML